MLTKKKYILFFFILIIHLTYSQVVINEVMPYPSGNQGLIVWNTASGNEYIELYNSSCSNSVNVSGYFIGDGQDFAGTISGGGFRIPNIPSAIIPPLGHLVLGTSTSSSDANSIDIKLPDYTSNYCLNTASRNFILANADGWVALYDAAGTPIDAIYWSSSASNINTLADFTPNPCVPSGSPAGVSLKSAVQIKSSFPSLISYAGVNPTVNKTFSRIPDGGSWQAIVNPSINDLSTGNCNGGTCASSFQIPATVTQPSCSASNGSITITPSPAVAGYTYSWTPNTSCVTASANNLAAASYSIHITSPSGCAKDTTITLTSSNAPTAIIVNPTNPSCGASNGQVVLGSVTGGVAPYQYNFNGLGLSNTTTYQNLSANSYTLVVQDNNGCSYTAPNVILSSSNAPTAIIVNSTNPSCGASDGQVVLGSVTGGVAPYQYNFNGLGLSNTTTYQNLSANSYTLVVQDNNGCSYTAPNVVLTSSNGPTAIIVNPTNPSCGQANGSVNIGNVTGGIAPYQYSFNGQVFTAATSFNNLSSGTYPLIVKDNNGCTYSTTSAIFDTYLTFNIITDIKEPSCANGDGSIEITNVTGGLSPYSYSFNSSAYSSVALYQQLSSGQYKLSVKDINGCVTDFNLLVPITKDESTLFIPNSFTPNDDGDNDTWFPKGYCITDYQCCIYNRWGEKISTLNSINEKWDGKYLNNKVEDGVYAYIIEAKGGDNKKIRRLGHIVLLNNIIN